MSVEWRWTVLGWLKINNTRPGTVVQAGDTWNRAQLSEMALAVQRTYADFGRDDAQFASYPLFYRRPVLPPPGPPVAMTAVSRIPVQSVAGLRVIALSTGSLIRVGCGGPLLAQSKIKHIRQFLGPVSPLAGPWASAELPPLSRGMRTNAQDAAPSPHMLTM